MRVSLRSISHLMISVAIASVSCGASAYAGFEWSPPSKAPAVTAPKADIDKAVRDAGSRNQNSEPVTVTDQGDGSVRVRTGTPSSGKEIVIRIEQGTHADEQPPSFAQEEDFAFGNPLPAGSILDYPTPAYGSAPYPYPSVPATAFGNQHQQITTSWLRSRSFPASAGAHNALNGHYDIQQHSSLSPQPQGMGPNRAYRPAWPANKDHPGIAYSEAPWPTHTESSMAFDDIHAPSTYSGAGPQADAPNYWQSSWYDHGQAGMNDPYGSAYNPAIAQIQPVQHTPQAQRSPYPIVPPRKAFSHGQRQDFAPHAFYGSSPHHGPSAGGNSPVINPYPSLSSASGGAVLSVTPMEANLLHSGAPHSSLPAAVGFGRDVPLALAVSQIAPEQYAIIYDPSVNQQTIVSWQGGRSWDLVLQEMLSPLGFSSRVAGNQVLIEQGGWSGGGHAGSGYQWPNSQEAHRYGETYAQAGDDSYHDWVQSGWDGDYQGGSYHHDASYNDLEASKTHGVDEQRNWKSQKGKSLRDTLLDWSAQVGVQLHWSSDYDFPLESHISVDGTFNEAVQNLLTGLTYAQPRPIGRLHPNLPDGPAVLIIDTKHVIK